MSRRRPRGLSAEEREIWNRVARTAHRRDGAAPSPEPAAPDPAPDPQMRPELSELPEPWRPAPFSLGQQSRGKTAARAAAGRGHGHDLAPDPAQALSAMPLRMDPKAHRKMVRGRIEPEARIDLHGMTQNEAHPELMRFVMGAHGRGLRLVLVITGKGKRVEDDSPIPRRVGVLRHQVPRWLAAPPLRLVVAQVTAAHAKHGGEGAYYVWLRRS